jgi:hypothetical protein
MKLIQRRSLIPGNPVHTDFPVVPQPYQYIRYLQHTVVARMIPVATVTATHVTSVLGSPSPQWLWPEAVVACRLHLSFHLHVPQT